jgi:uncharacterized protein
MGKDTSEKLKPSRYNHFVEIENGKRLAFNALTCGLAEMDPESYRHYDRVATSGGANDTPEELLKNLKLGGFVIPEDMDELDAIRAAHYQTRFGNNGFGLTIIPTYNCNFACDYCYERRDLHALPSKDGAVMPPDVYRRLVKLCETEIKDKCGFGVTWYGGEPLLARDTIENLTSEFLRICEERHCDYHAGMITNGYLLTPETLELMARWRISFVQVTVDGPSSVHDTRRPLTSGGPTYEKIMANLAHVTENSSIRIGLRVNIDKRNAASIPDLLCDLKKRGLHRQSNLHLHFGQVSAYTAACRNIAAHCMVSTEFSEFMVEAFKTAVNLGFHIATYPQRQISSCGAVSPRSLVVEPNGNLQTCWNTVGNEETIIGALSDNGIHYNNNLTRWLAWSPFVDQCNECNVFPLCMRGCPYQHLYKKDTGQGTADTCVWWKFNLREMLTIVKEAREQGLLTVTNAYSNNTET